MGLVFCFFLFPLNMNYLNICASCFRGGEMELVFFVLFLSFYLEHELLEHLFFLFLFGGGGGGGVI